ncbi:MAG: SusC/RagA family TonB-linked outer membrane protein, partial [Flavobacterium sp.]|nr:SusC/RagA family TonB-linked outer membrane protein [Candidatus Neoflavobacterium equi]
MSLLLGVQQIIAQQRTISGVVTEINSLPLPGASVSLKSDSSVETSTDIDGQFQLTTPNTGILVISYVGFNTVEIPLTSENSYSISLSVQDSILDEVIVVGYGVQKKKDVTGAISQIKGEDLQNLITPSFDQQLAGRAAGLQITTASGVIGEGPRIRIRGTSSINSSNAPLIVVDGVPIITSNLGGTSDINALADINTNDIESYEVLKDGAATAIYGSRAANGVILITTKKGKKDSFDINYSVQTGLGVAMGRYDLLNGDQFTVISNEKTRNRNFPDFAVETGFNTDWQKVVFRNSSYQTNHNLNLTSGTERGRYFLSLGYSEQEGIAIANDFKRYNVRASIEQDLNKNITIGGSVAANRNEIHAMNKNSNGLGGIMLNALSQLPNVPVLDPTNPTGYNVMLNAFGEPQNEIGFAPNLQRVSANFYNILYALNDGRYKSNLTRNTINAYANAKIIPGLNYRFQVGYDYANNDDRTFWGPNHGDGYGYNGLFQQYNISEEMYNVQNILSYETTIADQHNIGLTGVYEVQKNTYRFVGAIGRDVTSDFFNQNIISGAFGTQEISGSVSENGIKSLVGRATYNFDERYYLQGSIRRDGISKLHPDNRWQNLAGFSAGWNLSNESFWQDLKETVSLVKLRGSFAETGNTGFGNYAYQGLYGLYNYGDLNGVAYNQFGNQELFWEKSSKIDIGLDVGFLNNRFRLSADYFRNTSEDMIMDSAVPPSLGIPDNSITINAGKMINEGFEFDVYLGLVENKDFKWSINANLTLNKNKVVELPEGTDIFLNYSTVADLNNNNIIREGEVIHALYGYEYHGVNLSNGYPVYVKADGNLVQVNVTTNGVYEYNPDNPSAMDVPSELSATLDRKILGNPTPTYFGGINNQFKYQNFDLNFLVRYSG